MLISIGFVLVSICSFIAESHFLFRVLKDNTSVPAPNPELYTNVDSRSCSFYNYKILVENYPETVPIDAIMYIDWTCLSFFVIELIIRLVFAPNKCQFLRAPLNIIDIICIIPQTISLVFDQIHEQLDELAVTAGDILKIMSILRAVRVLRIFKLMKHYSAFKVLAYTVKVR